MKNVSLLNKFLRNFYLCGCEKFQIQALALTDVNHLWANAQRDTSVSCTEMVWKSVCHILRINSIYINCIIPHHQKIQPVYPHSHSKYMHTHKHTHGSKTVFCQKIHTVLWALMAQGHHLHSVWTLWMQSKKKKTPKHHFISVQHPSLHM